MEPGQYDSIWNLVYHHEHAPDDPQSDNARDPLSCRVTRWHHTALEFLAERWHLSKAGVAAEILETALNQMLEFEVPSQEPLVGDLQEAFEHWLKTREKPA